MEESKEETLEQLLSRLADGDRSAFSEVFRQLWPPTHRLCMSLLRNDADASDAAQEALAKILERAPDYDRQRRAMPWALAIAAWECRTLRKKHLRRREVQEQEAGERAGEDAQEELARRDLIHAALSALGDLSPTDREALIATFWEESAAVSGATFRKRRERALDRLRSSWRKLYGFD
jgi:RNA polymerase sigma-70 factor (ECF subfamily)